MAFPIIKTSELQLADQVRMTHRYDDGDRQINPLHLEKSPFLVRQIKDGKVDLWRPYIAHADFSCTSGVIPYVGIEEMTVFTTDSLQWLLIRRTELK